MAVSAQEPGQSEVVTRLRATLTHVTLFVWLAVSLYLAERAPKRFARLLQEDGVAEWLTVVLFLGAFTLCVRALREEPRKLDLSRLALGGLAFFCLFVAGEELSWGQRVFAYRPPELFLQHNYQQEANLHNLLKDILDTRWMVCLVAGVYGVLAAFLAHVRLFPRVLAPSITLLPWFAVVAWLEIAYPYELVGELAEMFLGALFLIDVAERTGAPREARNDERAPAPLAAGYAWCAMLLAALIVPLNDWVLTLRSDEAVATTRIELETLVARVHEAAVDSDRLAKKRHIHKRVFTAVKAGYLDLDARHFYLDPWNNPYWISYERGEDGAERLLVYSFGPNRRRDSVISEDGSAPSTLHGDDLGLSIALERPAHAAR